MTYTGNYTVDLEGKPFYSSTNYNNVWLVSNKLRFLTKRSEICLHDSGIIIDLWYS